MKFLLQFDAFDQSKKVRKVSESYILTCVINFMSFFQYFFSFFVVIFCTPIMTCFHLLMCICDKYVCPFSPMGNCNLCKIPATIENIQLLTGRLLKNFIYFLFFGCKCRLLETQKNKQTYKENNFTSIC